MWRTLVWIWGIQKTFQLITNKVFQEFSFGTPRDFDSVKILFCYVLISCHEFASRHIPSKSSRRIPLKVSWIHFSNAGFSTHIIKLNAVWNQDNLNTFIILYQLSWVIKRSHLKYHPGEICCSKTSAIPLSLDIISGFRAHDSLFWESRIIYYIYCRKRNKQ